MQRRDGCCCMPHSTQESSCVTSACFELGSHDQYSAAQQCQASYRDQQATQAALRTHEFVNAGRFRTLLSAPLPPKDPTRASATEGPLPGAKAGCHLPQAVSEAAMSDSACVYTAFYKAIVRMNARGPPIKLSSKKSATFNAHLALGLAISQPFAAPSKLIHYTGRKSNGPATDRPRLMQCL